MTNHPDGVKILVGNFFETHCKEHVIMRNVIAFILAAIMSAAIVFVASLLFFPSDKKGDSKNENEKTIELTVSQTDCRDALYGFSFSLNEEKYSLPCKYSVFERNGWVLRNPTEMIDSCSNMTDVYIKKFHRSLKTEIINYSDDSIMCCKGQIHSVSVRLSDFDTIDIPGAVTCDRRTTPELIMQRLGYPDKFDEDNDKITLTYVKAEYNNVRFVFYKNRSFDLFGDEEQDTDEYSEPFESGYYEHEIVMECRKDI